MSHFLSSCPFQRPLRLRHNGEMTCIDDASGELIFETDNKEAAYFVVKVINQLAKPDDLPALVTRLEAAVKTLEQRT